MPGLRTAIGRGFAKLIKGVLTRRTSLTGVVWLLDIRHSPSKEDVEYSHLLAERGIPLLVALTKADQAWPRGAGRAVAGVGEGAGGSGGAVRAYQQQHRTRHCGAGRERSRRDGHGGTMNKAWLVIAIALTMACAGASHAQSGETSVAGGDLPPPGYGTLGQDDISIRFNAGDIDIRMVPLDQRVMRLLGPDVYASLNKLTIDRDASIDSVAALGGASDPGLMLVSFFGRKDGVRFEPLNVFLVIRNQTYQPIGMVPFTSTITSRQLDTRQQASAIMVYSTPIPVYEGFGVSYGVIVVPNAWQNQLSQVQRERTRVMSKGEAGAGG
mgnify:CR=1 FL=1